MFVFTAINKQASGTLLRRVLSLLFFVPPSFFDWLRSAKGVWTLKLIVPLPAVPPVVGKDVIWMVVNHLADP